MHFIIFLNQFCSIFLEIARFAQGHYTEGAELIDSVLDVVRKEAEGEWVQVTLYQKRWHTCMFAFMIGYSHAAHVG